MSNLKAYLAEKYMSGPKADAILARAAPAKKKKRKAAAGAPAPTPAGSGALVKDDDAGWGDEGADDAEDLAEAVVASDRKFKKRRTAPAEGSAGWATIREGEGGAGVKEESPPPAADEQPLVVDAVEAPFVGGLITAERLRKVRPKAALPEATAEEAAAAQETVYRDASGKKIDTKAERAEAARLKREREEREAKKMEWGKGLVQREETERRRAELEKEKTRAFARHADDEELNEEQKSKMLWNDPAAAFLTKKRQKGPRKPQYTGPVPPPNRFGIMPGYRWDGVDRGNGFEKKLFQTKNQKKRQGLESYQWSVDDM